MSRRETRGGALPLIEWGEQLRRRRVETARRRRRILIVAAMAIGTIGSTIAVHPAPRLLWNATASAPIGLYRVIPGKPPSRADIVIAWPPAAVRELAAKRHYLPANVPLVKRVAAVPGDIVCTSGADITINGRPAVRRLLVDPHRRSMPGWRGCLTLLPGQVFLLMTESPQSFDGRYFGITEQADVIGVAKPLWVR